MSIKHLVEEMVSTYLTESTDKMHKLFSDVAAKYKDKEAKNSLSPSGPNTRTFTAIHSGMIEHQKNIAVARAHPFKPHVYDHFIKIGSNVDQETRENITKDIHAGLKKLGHKSVDYKGDNVDHLGKHETSFFRTMDKSGVKHQVRKESGSSWGGIGIEKNAE